LYDKPSSLVREISEENAEPDAWACPAFFIYYPLSTIKKSENGDYLIVRVYNTSMSLQKINLIFYKDLSINNAEIVNFLEQKPKNKIKAKINEFYQNKLTLTMEPHVIATIKLRFNP